MWRTRVRPLLMFRDAVAVCSIGSTDPTGSAGLFLDARVYAQIGGVRPSFVVAGVTAQNDRKVLGVEGLAPAAVLQQLEAVWARSRPDAVRVGLLPTAETCDAVTRFLSRLPKRPPIVVDPVILASSGGRLASDGAVRAMRSLIRLSTIVTPNAREAVMLANIAASANAASTVDAATDALARIARAVLVTGGDRSTGARVTDVLAIGKRREELTSRRIDVELRGTGCMLACAIAVSLARRERLPDAVRSGRRFVRAALLDAAKQPRRARRSRPAGVGARAV